jgi:hypothetical protein
VNKIVKVIVKQKSKPKDFEKFIDKLYKIGVQELKIVENFEIIEFFEITLAARVHETPVGGASEEQFFFNLVLHLNPNS